MREGARNSAVYYVHPTVGFDSPPETGRRAGGRIYCEKTPSQDFNTRRVADDLSHGAYEPKLSDVLEHSKIHSDQFIERFY